MKVPARTVMRSDLVLLLMLGLVVGSVAVTAASGRSRSIDDRAAGIESQLRCPTCQGLSIADSPATSAAQMRALVHEQLAAGRSDDDVRAFFVERYGRWILLDPPVSGPDLALWLAPGLIVAGGAFMVVRRARRPGEVASPRRWSAAVTTPWPRAGSVAIGAAIVLAVSVPIAAAIGPRLANQQISGGAVTQAGPSIEQLEAFVRAQPNDVDALVALGDALLAADRPADAADRYKAALAIDPANISALLGVGTILLGADRPDAAEPVFSRVLTLSPDQPDALLYRALARLRLTGSLTEDVRRDVERFLEVASAADPRRAMAEGLLPDATQPPSNAP